MAEDKIFTSFVCQGCSFPLKMDESLSSFSEHVSAELHLPIHSNPDVDLDTSQTNSFDHYVHPCRLTDSINGANDFTLISDEKETTNSLSQHFKVKAALFDTLSGNSNIDHPLCDECADYLIEILEQQLKDTENDYNDYLLYFNRLQSDDPFEPKLTDLEKELADLKAEEQRFLHELDAMRKEETEMAHCIREHETKQTRLRLEEDRYWREYTNHRKDLIQADEEARSLECQYNYTKAQLDKLNNTNVFNVTFHIWHQNHFGTINNFRLGRLPSSPVDWSEINAAWGQTALLLDALARKINLTFERYKVVPYGNHSYIEVLGEQKEFPLYGSGGFKFLWDTKFDNGMVAFLDCLQQFQERVERLQTGNQMFHFPYRTNKGKIEDKEASYSIKIQLNSEEQWTKALKFMLTNLKWGLAWISSQLTSEAQQSITTTTVTES